MSVLDELSRALLNSDLGRLRSWLSKRSHVLHFNCHSELAEEPTLERQMRVRKEAFIGRSEMAGPHTYDFLGTFVFLNACSSVCGTWSIKSSLAQFFRLQNASCVACTTGPVNDAFATRFAEQVYDLLLEGKAIVEAMFEARRTLDKGNPPG